MVSLNASTEPQGELGPQPWLAAAATRAVMAALTANGADVRFVGGCVRDALAKRAVGDIDIATPDKPERVIQLLEAAGIKGVPTGIEHGTVTAAPTAADDCAFAAPVCAARGAVFRIAAFDPVASAIRIGPRTLVTARR